MRSILLVLGLAISLTAAQRSIEDECSEPSAFLSCMEPFRQAGEKCASDDKVCECEEKIGIQDCGTKYCPEIAFPVSDTLTRYCRDLPSGCGGGVAPTGRCKPSMPTRTTSSEITGSTGTGSNPSTTSAPGGGGTESEDSADDEPPTSSNGSGDMLFAPVGGLLGSLVAIAALL